MKRFLVWLEWPEKCFRIDAEALRFLKSLVPAGSEVLRVKSEKSFLKALPSATHAIVWNFKPEWFALTRRLRVLATPGAGRELMPKEAPEGVLIHHGGYHGAIISESVAAFVLGFARGLFREELKGDRPWREAWPRVALGDKCFRVAGTKAVIAGYGKIGKAIGAKLESLGIKVEGFGRKEAKRLPEAVKDADWFIMALPGDTGTDNFLDAKLLRRLPKRAAVINVGRGNAIDEKALLAALRSGKIAGAYLDVFRGEPGPLDKVRSLALDGAILPLPKKSLPPNLVMTPHSSAFSVDYLKMCFEELKNDGLI